MEYATATPQQSAPPADEGELAPGKEPNIHLWQAELRAALKQVESWHERGRRVEERYRDERQDSATDSRWNLFYSNVATQQALLYGRPPQATVTRRFMDSADDAARVAGDILQRLINVQIEDGYDDPYAQALQNALLDLLLPGLGIARVVYTPTFKEVPEVAAVVDPVTGAVLAEAVPAHRVKEDEQVTTSYVYWQDFLWSSGARTWEEVRWVGFRSLLSRTTAIKRFGEANANLLQYKNQSDKNAPHMASGEPDPMARAEVWEVWDKEERCVYWLSEVGPRFLDVKKDPLRLRGFFPCPRPMVVNLTNKEYLPRPDFALAQDLYNQIDQVQSKIAVLTKAVSVKGFYDETNKELLELLEEARNRMYPVKNWAGLAQAGGIRGSVDWFPLEAITSAISFFQGQLSQLQAQLYEVTGMSDILRGAGAASGVTATAEGINAQFGSARLKARQEDFARFASDLARLKAEVIATMFESASILAQSNMMSSPDADLAFQAIDLIKSDHSAYRIAVRPESLSLVDFAQQNSARMNVVGQISTFIGATASIVQAIPGAQKHLLALLRWAVAAMPGASEAEGILDKAIADAETAAQQPQQPGPPPPPDPKVVAQQMKTQGELAKIEAEKQARKEEEWVKVAADAQREQNQAQANIAETAARTRISMAAKQQMEADRRLQQGLLGGGQT